MEPQEKETLSADAAKQIIEQEKQERIKRCNEKISQILKEEKCVFDISFLITAEKSFPQIRLVAID